MDTITLRPYRDSDLPVLWEIRNDAKIQRLLMARNPKPNSTEQVVEWVRRREKDVFLVVAKERRRATPPQS